jgi:hypothetical protein
MYLDMSNNNITHINNNVNFNKMQYLTKLTLRNNGLNKMNNLNGLGNLKYLDISENNDIKSLIDIELDNFHSLKYLKITDTQISIDHLAQYLLTSALACKQIIYDLDTLKDYTQTIPKSKKNTQLDAEILLIYKHLFFTTHHNKGQHNTSQHTKIN